jgi:hypothetical protein
MGVTRIRYLLDQWRLRSMTLGLPNPFPQKERPVPGWEFPPLHDLKSPPPSRSTEPSPPSPDPGT